MELYFISRFIIASYITLHTSFSSLKSGIKEIIIINDWLHFYQTFLLNKNHINSILVSNSVLAT